MSGGRSLTAYCSGFGGRHAASQLPWSDRDLTTPEIIMARTLKKQRAAGTEAVRRWRERRAEGRRLVGIEVADATLQRLANQGLLSITELNDPAALAAAIAFLVNAEYFFTGLVSDFIQPKIQQSQGFPTSNAVTKNAGGIRPIAAESAAIPHLQLQGRNARGRWVRGTSGNPAGKKPGTPNYSKSEDQLMRLMMDALSRRG